jgi:predicted DNA-binding protein
MLPTMSREDSHKGVGIQVPRSLARRLEKIKEKTGHSYSLLARIALEFVIAGLESGELAVVNGEIQRASQLEHA